MEKQQYRISVFPVIGLCRRFLQAALLQKVQPRNQEQALAERKDIQF